MYQFRQVGQEFLLEFAVDLSFEDHPFWFLGLQLCIALLAHVNANVITGKVIDLKTQ